MNNVEKIEVEDRRLRILEIIHADSDFSISANLLQGMLASRGHNISMAVLLADVTWLQSIGAVNINRIGAMQVVILSEPGIDIVLGRSVVPGVARPAPI